LSYEGWRSDNDCDFVDQLATEEEECCASGRAISIAVCEPSLLKGDMAWDRVPRRDGGTGHATRRGASSWSKIRVYQCEDWRWHGTCRNWMSEIRHGSCSMSPAQRHHPAIVLCKSLPNSLATDAPLLAHTANFCGQP
jgi:hypothetical protein